MGTNRRGHPGRLAETEAALKAEQWRIVVARAKAGEKARAAPPSTARSTTSRTPSTSSGSSNPNYLRSAADGRVKNLRDWGVPLGRRFRALKLWSLVRAEGVAGLQGRLRRDLDNARWLAAQVRAAPHWKVIAPVPLQTVCLRHEPPGIRGVDLDRHTRAWAERVNRSSAAYLTPATLDGRWVVRVSIGAEPTEREHVESLWRLRRQEAEGV
jgi:aromatic-L-amino-acid decarboxylase